MKNSILLFIMVFLTLTSTVGPVLNAQPGESELILKTASGDIFGTLMLPEKCNSCTVALIIAGSGPTDRNGNSAMGIKTDTYKKIAEELAFEGIATLRYDKRGIGASRAAMTTESELRFETYIRDAEDWIRLLRGDKKFSRVIVIGHSEGSLIGMVAAREAEADAFISIAGVGKPADQLLREQLRPKLPPQLMAESDSILDSLKAGKTVSQVNPVLAALYRPGVQPYMISWIKYDPAAELAKLKMPVLIVQGTTDLQVTVADAKLLSAALPSAPVFIVENMNHVLKECNSDTATNIGTYNKPELPLKEGLIDRISAFITTGK
jgi:uncharacterized protein